MRTRPQRSEPTLVFRLSSSSPILGAGRDWLGFFGHHHEQGISFRETPFVFLAKVFQTISPALGIIAINQNYLAKAAGYITH